MNNITELVFILDRSCSMSGLESDTIGGFNSMIARQKKQEGEAFVTTVLFDNEIELLHDRVPPAKLEPLTDRDYTVRGCTALIDAIGETVEHIDSIHRYAREEDIPAHVMFVITTDGMENASTHFTSAEVKTKIELKKAQGWEFLFIGANIDAVGTAAQIGISRERAVNYHADRRGTRVVFDAVADVVGCVCRQAPVPRAWSEEIEADFECRAGGDFSDTAGADYVPVPDVEPVLPEPVSAPQPKQKLRRMLGRKR